jgi:signal transduction histidine kinase
MRPALWSRIARSVAAHPVVVDVVLAVSLTVVSVLQGLDDDTGRWRPFDGPAIVLTALTTMPNVFRRRAPVTVALTCCAFWLLTIALGYPPVVSSYGVLLALYSVAASRPWPYTVVMMAIGGSIWVAAWIPAGTTSILSVVVQGVVIPAVVWKIASGARELAERNRQLAEAADQLYRDREERARRAVTDERLRIARELHDIVAHHMSVIAIQAGLARYVLRSDPDTAHAAIGTVLETGTEALEEMRRMLALLRVEPETDGYDPAPGLAHLPELFSRVRLAGVPVEVTVEGTPQPLSPGIELCAYRVIQEGLTNVLRHATPATARIILRYGPREFVAVIRDDGRAAAASSGTAAPGAVGQGLIGMRERAMLYGGTVEAGPRPGGGFEVRLVLPASTPPPHEVPA